MECPETKGAFDKVASFGQLVARKTGLMHGLVGSFAAFELTESPAARRGVFP